jgi:hypothetical protein
MTVLLIYLFVGAFAGTIAGLFGVGGGVVIVPALVFAFTLQGMPIEVLTHTAVGTSLATIVITSISSVKAHHQKGAVLWPVVAMLTPGICVGVWLGVQTAALISGAYLQLAIGCFLLLVSAQMGLGLKPAASRELPGRLALTGVGGIIGWVSALFGIGGGSMTVPYLSFCNVNMQKAVASSAACGLPIALVGAVSNGFSGFGHPAADEWATGYIYWPAFVGLAVASAPFAKVGAGLAHRLPADVLKRIFAAFLLCVGTIMILKGAQII